MLILYLINFLTMERFHLFNIESLWDERNLIEWVMWTTVFYQELFLLNLDWTSIETLCLMVKNKNPINSSLQKWAEQLTSRKLQHSYSPFLKVDIEITSKMGEIIISISVSVKKYNVSMLNFLFYCKDALFHMCTTWIKENKTTNNTL